MKNEFFLGQPNNGWVEIKIGDFKCEASNLSNIPFDILNSAIASLENKIPFSLNIELEKEGDATICSFFNCTYIIHDNYGQYQSYRYDINHKEIIHTFVSKLKKEVNKWCVWDGNEYWDNEEKIENCKKQLLDKINKVEELLK